MRALDKSKGFLQARINTALHMKRTPAARIRLRQYARQRSAHREAHEARRRSAGQRGAADLRRSTGETEEGDGESEAGKPNNGKRGRREGAAADLAAVCRRRGRAQCRAGGARTADRTRSAPPPACSTCSRSSGWRLVFTSTGMRACLSRSICAVRHRHARPAAGARSPVRTRLRQPSNVWHSRSHRGTAASSTSITITTTRCSVTWSSCAARRAAPSSLRLRYRPCPWPRPSVPAAAALFAGVSFDTGHLRHDSTTAATFETAAWLPGSASA